MVQFSKEYWLVISLMAVTFLGVTWIRAPKEMGGEANSLQDFPKRFDGWTAEEHFLDEKISRVLQAEQTLLRDYVNADGRRVELFIGFYREQKLGAQVHSPIYCLPGAGWSIIRFARMPFPFDSTSFATELHTVKNNEKQLVLYWFVVDRKRVKNEWELKLQIMINAARHRPTSVCFYRLCVRLSEDHEERALQSLREFLLSANQYLFAGAKA